jgi:Flp pilus assembly protein TadB
MKESIVLLMLGACWAGYLAWYWRENKKTSHRRSDGIRAFSSGLGTLGGSASRAQSFAPAVPALAPRSAHEAARRRREVMVALVAAAVFTFLAAVAIGGAAIFLHVVVDLALASYAYALVQRRNDEAEREIKVHMLYPERVPEPAVVRPREVVNS